MQQKEREIVTIWEFYAEGCKWGFGIMGALTVIGVCMMLLFGFASAVGHVLGEMDNDGKK